MKVKKDLFSQSRILARASKHIRDVFDLWGYEEIFLPAVEEYSEQLRDGLKITYNNAFYLVKPDITSQIVVNLKNGEPRRLCYISEVLKDGINGRWQAGAEFIGGSDMQMVLEILSLIITLLERLGIENFYIDIGSIMVWENALKDVSEYREEVFLALKRRNFGVIEELDIPDQKKEELWYLFNFRGRKSPCNRLNEIVENLNDERVFIDFGTIRFYPYYEDIVFEVYSSNVGHPLGGGGSYRVGSMKACGFAMNLEVIAGLARLTDEDGRIILKGKSWSAYEQARKLVMEKKKVRVI